MQESGDFFRSIYNFYGHTEPILEFKNATLASKISVPNDLGLVNNLTLVYKDYGLAAYEANDENLFWIPKPITQFSGNLESLNNELAIRQSKLCLLYQQIQESLVHDQFDFIQEGVNLSHPFGWYAFGHLYDSLSKLYWLQRLAGATNNIKYIISNPSRIKDFWHHMSALAGHDVDDSKVVFLDTVTRLRFARLLNPLPPVLPTYLTPEVHDWILNSYYGYFNIKERSPASVVYLSRNKIREGSRQVLNEEEVLGYLEQKKCIVLSGDEPLSDIINVFSSAAIVIGAHGSLFANTIFCQSSAVILEFCPKTRPDISFARKHKRASAYYQLLVDADPSHNISIDIAILKQYL